MNPNFPYLRTAEKKRRKARKRQETAAAQAELAGKPPPVLPELEIQDTRTAKVASPD